MRRYFLLFFTIFLISILTSCDKIKITRSTKALLQFEEYYKLEDVINIGEMYPGIYTLIGDYRKLDNIEVLSTKINDNDIVEISTQWKWTNPFGKLFSNNVVFFMQPSKSNGKTIYRINNTKNFVDCNNLGVYKYAVTIEPYIAALKDIEKSTKCNGYNTDFENDKLLASTRIKEGLDISNFRWQSGYYSNYASGSAIVKNTTEENLSCIIRYKVEYLRGGRIVTEDIGIAQYDGLPAGGSTSFSFYSDNVGNAQSARIKCFVDDEEVIEAYAIKFAYIKQRILK